MNYYPSQGSVAQPVMVMGSHHGSHHGSHYGSHYGSHHGHHHGHGHHHHYPSDSYYVPPPMTVQSVPVTMVPSSIAPVVMQSSHSGHHHHYHRPHRTFGERLRRWFGLAPITLYKYKPDRSSFGFMGYARRPRYVDARTGAEVDRYGRPVYRV